MTDQTSPLTEGRLPPQQTITGGNIPPFGSIKLDGRNEPIPSHGQAIGQTPEHLRNCLTETPITRQEIHDMIDGCMAIHLIDHAELAGNLAGKRRKSESGIIAGFHGKNAKAPDPVGPGTRR